MPDDIVDEIVNRLPVDRLYDDAVSPAAKETGALGEDLVKVVRLALFPFQIGAAVQDRLRAFVDQAVRKVPEERRVPPPPQILGPVLEGIRYEPAETPIDDMFNALLSTSMDSERIELAHPAFPQLIRQLSRDEAIILRALRRQTYTSPHTLDINPRSRRDGVEPYWINTKVENELSFPTANLFYLDRFHFYTDHLFHLGLVHFRDTRPTEPIRDGNGRQTGVREFKTFELQPLGRALVEACLQDEKQPS